MISKQIILFFYLHLNVKRKIIFIYLRFHFSSYVVTSPLFVLFLVLMLSYQFLIFENSKQQIFSLLFLLICSI